MTSRIVKFELFQKSVIENLIKLNEKIDKLCALTVSNQLLQECVGPDGSARTADECGEIVVDSFMAGICLAEDLNSRCKEFEYQKSEFFIDNDSDIDESQDEEDDDDDDNSQEFNTNRCPVNAF
jgi:hypothetical protein